MTTSKFIDWLFIAFFVSALVMLWTMLVLGVGEFTGLMSFSGCAA